MHAIVLAKSGDPTQASRVLSATVMRTAGRIANVPGCAAQRHKRTQTLTIEGGLTQLKAEEVAAFQTCMAESNDCEYAAFGLLSPGELINSSMAMRNRELRLSTHAHSTPRTGHR